MNVKEAGRREGEVANWSDCVSGNFGGLAGLSSSGPSAALFLNGWQHEALRDELSCCLNTGLAEEVQGVENLTAEETGPIGVVYQKRCRSTARLRSQG